MKNTQVVYPLFGLVESEDPILTSLTDIDQLFIFPKGESCGGTQAAKG
jgi:hypothetical protein